MAEMLRNGPFLLVAATNFSLFLVMSTWTLLPLYIVELGGNTVDVGLVMGSLGITSLGSLPFLAPLIDRHGRKRFILGGILVIGLSNAAYLLVSEYSPALILIRLIQGLAFAACFNGCSTAVIDLIPAEKRAQGIGLFGISGSMAIAVGPFLGEACIHAWGYTAYFLLLLFWGLAGLVPALFIREPARQCRARCPANGFFSTASRDGFLPMMILAALFGAGFSAITNFLPLYTKSLGMRAGLFFCSYGATLIFVRIFLGTLLDRVTREYLIVACLFAFGFVLISTCHISSLGETVCLGILFGFAQGFSYPTMMAGMVDRSRDGNRAVVVALFTGSFGVGINASVPVWGVLADLGGLPFMFFLGGSLMLACAAFRMIGLVLVRTQRT